MLRITDNIKPITFLIQHHFLNTANGNTDSAFQNNVVIGCCPNGSYHFLDSFFRDKNNFGFRVKIVRHLCCSLQRQFSLHASFNAIQHFRIDTSKVWNYFSCNAFRVCRNIHQFEMWVLVRGSLRFQLLVSSHQLWLNFKIKMATPLLNSPL